MKSYYMKEEYERNRIGDGISDPVLAFKWCKIDNNKYAIYMPKIFTKSAGDTLSIVNKNKMMEMLESTLLEAK